VELLVAPAAWHQQIGVVLAPGQADPEPGRVVDEVLPVRRDHATGGRHDDAPAVDRLEDLVDVG
jgi:hypothetical protein